ncbi:MAG TPA: VOC family protein [Candidatus Krumholzibacteriaceae bacterium]|nr:VOC family protein [Candidatus Krumholzibacteriaceae bacterium]
MTKLDHIGFIVSDLEKSLAFYQKLFGFKVVKRFTFGTSNIVLLDVGDGLLELIQRPGPGTPPVENRSHIALLEPDFDEKVKTLGKMGVEKRLIDGDNGDRLCFFQDPDGHTLELTELGLGS